MTSKELYEHKEAYEEVLTVLKKHEGLPKVNHAIWELERCIKECQNYERWKINKPNWEYGYDLPCDAYIVKEEYIPSQAEGLKYLSKPTEFFVLHFSTGAYIFGDDYPKQLFADFFAELIARTKPQYVDSLNSTPYYTEETAGNAYEVVQELYKKYQAKHKNEANARRIEQLQAELANLIKERNKGELESLSIEAVRLMPLRIL